LNSSYKNIKSFPVTLLLSGLLIFPICIFSQDDSLVKENKYENLNMQQFNHLVQRADKPVLVNFSADWCIVCKRQEPILQQLVKRHKDEFEMIEIDMEQNPEIAKYFEVDGLPVHMIYRKGTMSWNRVGFQTFTELETQIWENRIIPQKENLKK
jgi:thioredoxin 1